MQLTNVRTSVIAADARPLYDHAVRQGWQVGYSYGEDVPRGVRKGRKTISETAAR